MTTANAMLRAPPALRATHDELHAALLRATDAPGRVGAAARALACTLNDHLEREERLALPPLALLRRLAEGGFDRSMVQVLPLTDALREELPRMLCEHRAIRAAAEKLATVAREEGDHDCERLAEGLRRHALEKEQIAYPAALLVGEIVRRRAEPTSADG